MSKTSARPMYGWDLVYNSEENNIIKKDDVLILLVHWCLTNKGFRCIGLGQEEAPSRPTDGHLDGGTETLPNGWNTSADGSYSLCYNINEVSYTLCGTRAGDIFILNLLRCTDHKVSSIALEVEVLVKNLTGSIEAMVPEYKSVLTMTNNQLIAPVHCTSHEVQTQTAEPQSSGITGGTSWDPHSSHRPGRQPHGVQPTFFSRSLDPRNVGRSDLDPLGNRFPGSGGGMLFDPFRRDRSLPPGAGNLPQGSVPPGARFDPIGPVNPHPERPQPTRPGGFQPDPDHLPPPGFEDFIM